MNNPLANLRDMEIAVDRDAQIITIHGVRYSFGLFAGLGLKTPDNRFFQIVSNVDGVLVLRSVDPAGPVHDPIPMILFCPKCHRQHIDAPEPGKGWDNPPHRSHLCAFCGTIWRPSDACTTGAASILTSGAADNWQA